MELRFAPCLQWQNRVGFSGFPPNEALHYNRSLLFCSVTLIFCNLGSKDSENFHCSDYKTPDCTGYRECCSNKEGGFVTWIFVNEIFIDLLEVSRKSQLNVDTLSKKQTISSSHPITQICSTYPIILCSQTKEQVWLGTKQSSYF